MLIEILSFITSSFSCLRVGCIGTNEVEGTRTGGEVGEVWEGSGSLQSLLNSHLGVHSFSTGLFALNEIKQVLPEFKLAFNDKSSTISEINRLQQVYYEFHASFSLSG